MMRDSLGDRMKSHYEDRTRLLLPRRTYTLIRVDGKSFHSYTKGCVRPFGTGLMEDMDQTAVALCRDMEGAALASVQSDEISILLTDFATAQTGAWFDGSVQKLASISASLATAHFNLARQRRAGAREIIRQACFDSRAFTIPDPVGVENYSVWRGQDATRNSISVTAQAHFPHERLQSKSSHEMQEMLWQERSINWNDIPGGSKRGRCVIRTVRAGDVEYTDGRTGEMRRAPGVERHQWSVVVPPIVTHDRAWLQAHIPRVG